MTKDSKLGKTVTWESQASGSRKRKTGTIVCVVPAHTVWVAAWREAGEEVRNKYVGCSGFGLIPREHESYLVAVPQGPKAKPQIYFPRVSQLQFVEDASEEESA